VGCNFSGDVGLISLRNDVKKISESFGV